MRLVNWESRLMAYIAGVARTGFAFGQHDCALFAAGGVEAVTGDDPAHAWRGRYVSQAGGIRRLRRSGHDDHIAAARALFPKLHPSGAMLGDLAVVPSGDGLGAIGIVQGEMIYVLRPDGLGLLPASAGTIFLGVR